MTEFDEALSWAKARAELRTDALRFPPSLSGAQSAQDEGERVRAQNRGVGQTFVPARAERRLSVRRIGERPATAHGGRRADLFRDHRGRLPPRHAPDEHPEVTKAGGAGRARVQHAPLDCRRLGRRRDQVPHLPGEDQMTPSPCPRCREVDRLEYEFSGSCGYVTCLACGLEGPLEDKAADPYCDADAAWDAWNRRAPSQPGGCAFCGGLDDGAGVCRRCAADWTPAR